MQNIEAILAELGIEVPSDKKGDLTKKVSENYVTKAEHEKKIGKAETERDNWKSKAERDASAFVDEEQEKAKQQAARFTVPGTGKSTGGTGAMTKDDIMKIKDASERQTAIAQNLNLFGKGE